MKVLLTGSNGFLGRNIIGTLFTKDILTLSRSNADICADLAAGVPDVPNVDLVIHSAGKAHVVPSSLKESEEFYRVNVNGTRNLLLSLQKCTNTPRYFVFISSVAVYGATEGAQISEDHPLNAADPYGQSKIEAEAIIQDWCRAHSVECSILRLPLIAGLNPPGNLKAMIKGIKMGYYCNVGGGRARRSIVLADDIAKVIPVVAPIGGVYNLTDGVHPSLFTLSSIIAGQLGKRTPYNIPMWVASAIAKFGDIFGAGMPINSTKLKKMTSDLTFDDSKARRQLGWNPTPVLDRFSAL